MTMTTPLPEKAGRPRISAGPGTSFLPRNTRFRPRSMGVMLVGTALLIGTIVGFFLSPTAPIAGAWCIGMMLVLMFLGVPVAAALAIPSIIGVYGLSGIPATVNILATTPYTAAAKWTYSVLPLFIFMGMLLSQSGLTQKIYRATDRWFSWLPGGLAIGTTAAGAGLSSVSGSTIGMTYALGRAAIPEMLRAGYDKRVALGSVIVAGLPGNLIPPSILLVVYAGIASVPVGPQLVAGAVPGLLVAVFVALFILLLGIVSPKLVGRGGNRGPSSTWAQRLSSLGEVWGFPVILVVLFGGMFSGAFTPTEAGAAAALTALIITLIEQRGSKPFACVARAALATVSASAAIFFIMIGAEMLTRLLAITGLAEILTGFVTGLGLSRVGFLVVLIGVYLVMGMFFDTLAMMLLTVPILLPAVEAMGVNALWFGVFVVLLGEIGMLTPPVGILSYIVHTIAKKPDVNLGTEITLGDVFRSLVWFLPIPLLFLVFMIVFPQVAEWLPGLLESAGGR